ncbi:hypothetical protein ABPG75_011498 [Micractinium tetrahymenae]
MAAAALLCPMFGAAPSSSFSYSHAHSLSRLGLVIKPGMAKVFSGRPAPACSAAHTVILNVLLVTFGLCVGMGLQSVRVGSSGGGGGSGSSRLVQLAIGKQLSLQTSAEQGPEQQQNMAGAAGAALQREDPQQQAQPPPGPAPFQPDGYELPAECAKHSVLFPSIFNELRPWMVRGISRADMDACAAVAPAGHNISEGTPQINPHDTRYRLLLWDNELYVTSGGLERPPMAQVPLYYHMLTQMQDAARRFGAPNMELGLGFGDMPLPAPILRVDEVGEEAAGFPEHMCPLLAYAKFREQLTLLVPSGEFVWKQYDDYVKHMLESSGQKWEDKEQRAIGRWTLFDRDLAQVDRFGHQTHASRHRYANLSRDSNYTRTSLMDGSSLEGFMSLSRQLAFRYTFSTDGLGVSSRLAKVLATGQVCVCGDGEFYYPALHAWQHYVPTGCNGWDEVDRIVQFLRDHDSLARSIAENGRRFAATHLITEGRHCYIKVLLEELAKLMNYQPHLEDFPARVSLDEEMAQHLVDPGAMKPRPEV